MFADLPPEDERHALIDALAELVEKCGPEPLVSWPVLLADPEHFPDPWSPDLEGVQRMVLRLMSYAGLRGLDVELEAFEEEEFVEFSASMGGMATRRQRHGAAAWFRGIRDRTCRFGVEASQLEDPELLVGVLAHEVAHAYRAHHGLMIEDTPREEQLTDLTTVFLGFGVLTTNAADRYRSSGGMEKGLVMHQWRRQQAGYLSPPTMSFLLAAQAVARGTSSGDRRRLKGRLEHNQAASFAAALSWLDARSTELRRRLGISLATPRREVAPRPIPMPPRVSAAPGITLDKQQPQQQANAGRPVFRTRPSGFGLAGWGLEGFVVGMVIGAILKSVWPMLMGPVVLVALRKWILSPMCSGCEHGLSRHADTCPKCGGFVAGDIRRMRDRHDAEEFYWAQHGGRPEWMTRERDVEDKRRSGGFSS